MAEYNVGQAYLSVLPSLEGFGADVRRQLAEQDMSATADIKPELDSAQLDAQIEEVKAKIDELSGKDVALGVDDTDAKAEIDLLKAKLDELEAKRVEVKAAADTAEAKAGLDDVKLKADELDGKTATVKVKADTSDAQSQFSLLGTAIAALGPALVPIAGAAVGGLGAMAVGAVTAAGALGVTKLAFDGVGGAVTQVEQAQQKQGQNAAQVAAQEISSANSVANAQDSLANAVENVGVVQETSARAVAAAQEQQQAAAEALGVAEASASRSVYTALEQQQQAEQSLESSIRSQTQAQQALTQARIDAQNALVNATLAVQDNALAQRSAQLSLESAQQNLSLLAPTATALQRQQAQLAVDQAQQQIIDTKAMGDQLAQRNQQLQAQGVSGSQQVTSAQNALVAANDQVSNSQTRLKDATDAVTRARVDGDRQVADAERHLGDTEQAVNVAEEQGTRQVAAAKQAVVTATRALQSAEASAAATQATINQQNNAAAQALANLAPAQRDFVQFLVALQPQITAVKQAAAGGLLPGVEDGIKAILPIMPLIIGLVTTFSGALGGLARDTGQALNTSFWQGFITFINGEAGPSINTFGTIVGNLARGAAGLVETLGPLWNQMGAGLEHLSADFADFGQHAGTNSEWQNFLKYVAQEGPVVVSTIGNLIGAVVHLGEALAPTGAVVLEVVNAFAQFIEWIPTPVLKVLEPVLISLFLAWQGYKVISSATKSAQDFFTVITSAPGKIRTFISDFTNLLVKWGLLPGLQTTATVTLEENTVATTTHTVAQEADTVAAEEQEAVYGVKAIDLDALTASYAGETVAMEADTVATDAATASTGALDIAMAANPIGAVIAVLTVLIITVVEVWQHFDTLKGIVVDAWHGIGDAANAVWTGVLKPVFDAIGGAINAVVGAFQAAINNIGNIWGGLGNIVKAPVNFVIDPIYDKGIAGLWNDIAGVFGLPTLPLIPTLAAGGVLPGYSPGQDTVPALLSPGEGVLVPEAVQALGPDFVHWANSTFSSRPGGNQPGHYAAGGIVSDIAGLFTDPVGTVTKLFAGVVGQANQTPGAGLLHQAMVAVPGKVVAAVIDKAKALIASAASAITGSFGGGVEQWRSTGIAALASEGRPAAEIGPLLAQMTTESGGNPTVVNKWDSNWVAGTPSVGLMQVIGPTYASYKDPRFDKGPYEYGVSVDPMANITSAIRYTVAAYGNPSAIWGQGHGYDAGGWLPPGTSLAVNNTRAPEAVLTKDQWSAVMSRASQPPVTVNVYPRANHSETEIADQVSRQLALTMRSAL